jgi:hypothetical protein
VKWCSCFGAQCDSSSRGEHTATVWLRYSTPPSIPKGNKTHTHTTYPWIFVAALLKIAKSWNQVNVHNWWMDIWKCMYITWS